MSTRDERVVSLKFDNAQFERGASESMSTLDKLKEKLKFKDSEKDLDKLQKSVDNVRFDKITKSLESLEKRFSTMGIAGMRIIENLTDKALSGLAKIEQATLGQIRQGGWSRAMNLANAQFQIEGLGYTWDEVLKSVNYAVDGTAYGLDAAASAAAQLAASGVDFTHILKQVGTEGITQMHIALRGISGVAAMSNSSYEEIAHVFTRIAGQGKVMATDLNSIAARGLNATAELAKYLGTTEATVKDLVREGEIDFQTFATAMDSAFGEHAKDANKTFQGSMSNMKAALSRIGALFAQPIVDKTNTLFVSIKDQINNAKKALSDLKDEEGRIVQERFESHWAQAWEAMVDAVSRFVDSIDPNWFQAVADVFDRIAVGIRDFFLTFGGIIDKVQEKVETAKENIIIPLQDAMAAFKIFFNGEYGNGNARVKALQAAGRDAKKVQTLINEWYKAGFDPAKLAVQIEGTNAADLADWLKELAKNGYKFDKVQKKLGESVSEATEELSEEEYQALLLEESYRNIGLTLLNLSTVFDDTFATIGNVVKGAFDSLKKYFDPYGFTKRISDAAKKLSALSGDIRYLFDFTLLKETNYEIERLQEALKNGQGNAQGIVDEIERLRAFAAPIQHTKEIFDSLARSFYNIVGTIRNLGRAALTVGKAIFRAFVSVFNPDGVASGIEEVTWTFASFSEKLVLFAEKISPLVESGFYVVFSVIKTGISLIKTLTVKIVDFFGSLLGVDDMLIEIDENGNEIIRNASEAPTLIDRISAALIRVGDWVQSITDFFNELFELLANNEGVNRLKDALSATGEVIGGIVIGSAEAAGGLSDLLGNQNERKSAAQTVADAIGWIADKLAMIVEFVPKATAAIMGFFDAVRGKASEFLGWGEKEVDPYTEMMKARYGDPETIIGGVYSNGKADEIKGKISAFCTTIGTSIKDGVGSIDFDKLKYFAILGVTLYSIFALGRTADRLSSVPKSISNLFNGLAKGVKNWTFAMKEEAIWKVRIEFLKALVEAFIALSSMIVILGKVDQQVLARGLSVYLFLTIGMGIIITAISSVIANKKSKITNNYGFVNIANTISGLAAIGILLLGFGAVLYSLAKTMSVLDQMTNVERSLGGVVGLMLVVGIWVGVMIGLLTWFVKKTEPLKSSKLREESSGTKISAGGAKLLGIQGGQLSEMEKSPLTGPILALSAVLVSFSIAIGILAIAAAILDKLDVSLGAIGKIGLVVLAMTAAISLMVYAVGRYSVDGWQMLAIAAALIAFCYGIKLMATSLALLLAEVAVIAKLGGDSALAGLGIAFLGIAGIVMAIGGAVALMASQMSKIKGAAIWSITATIGAVIGLIAAIAVALGYLAQIQGNLKSASIALIATLGLSLLALVGALWAIGKFKIDWKQMLGLSAALVSIGGSALLFAFAMERIGKMDKDGFERAAKTLGVFMVAFAGILALLIFTKKGTVVLDKFAKIIEAIGLAALLGGAGILLVGAGLALLNKTLPDLAVGLELIFGVFKRHKAAALIISGAIIAILGLIYKFLKPILVVLYALGSVIGDILKFISKGVGSLVTGLGHVLSAIASAIGNFFKTYGPVIMEKLAKWWENIKEKLKKLPGKIKALIVLMMTSLGASLSAENGGKASLLSTVGDVFRKLLNYLKKGMPAFVGEILDLLLSAVDALAGGIQRRSARFAAAFWVIVSTLIGLLGDIIGQGLGMLGINVDFSDASAQLYKKAAYNSAAAEFADVEKLYKSGEATYAEYIEAQRKLSAAQKELIASSENEIKTAALVDKGHIEDATVGLKTNIGSVQALVEMLDGKEGHEAQAVLQSILGEETGQKLYTKLQGALNQMGVKIGDLNTEEGFKKVMEFAALREAVELEQARASDMGIDYDAEGKKKWADNDYGEASWFLTVFAPYLRTDQKYIDLRNKQLEDTDALLDYQAKVQAKAAEIVYGDKLGFKIDTEKYAKDLKTAKKLYGEQTDYSKRMAALYGSSAKQGSQEYATLHGNLNFNMSQGYDIRSDQFYAELMADGFVQVFDGKLGNDLANSKHIIIKAYQGYATDDDIIKASQESAKTLAIKHVDAQQDEIQSDDSKKKVDDSMDKMLSWVKDKAPGFLSGGEDIGGNLLAGFANSFGLNTDEAKEVLNSLKEFDETTIDASKAHFGEKSPSKVFAQIGSYCVQGLSNGINDNLGLAESSGAALSQRTIDAFGNPLDYVSKVMSGELTYDPSIRPIMDMSSIQSGANSVNGMFQNQNVAISGFSGRLAADIGQLQRDNQDVVDEIALLREDMAEMTEQITNLQVVMDNGALVGQLAGGMDQELGTRASRKGRGI